MFCEYVWWVEPDCHRIYALAFGYNSASRRVLEKCGFQLEGTYREAIYREWEWHDEWVLGEGEGRVGFILNNKIMKFDYKDQLKFEEIFEMDEWYVLNFTNSKFRMFVDESIWIDIYHSDKYTQQWESKANRMRQFWKTTSSNLVWKLMLDLLDYWKTYIFRQNNYESIQSMSAKHNLYDECVFIAKKLVENWTIEIISIEWLQKINHDYIKEHIEKCDKKMIEWDYSWAISSARSLIESVLLHIWEERWVRDKWSKYNWDLKPLHNLVSASLNLSKAKFKEGNRSIWKIISWLNSIIDWMTEISWDMWDRHWKWASKKSYVVEKHHATLSVNAVKTYSTFILDVHNKLENIDLSF